MPISVLDFLMVTSMLLVTDADEWTDIIRAGSAVTHREDDHSVVDIEHRPSRASSSLSLSSEAVSAASPLEELKTIVGKGKARAAESDIGIQCGTRRKYSV